MSRYRFFNRNTAAAEIAALALSGCVTMTNFRVIDAAGDYRNDAVIIVDGKIIGRGFASREISDFAFKKTIMFAVVDGLPTPAEEAEKEVKAAAIVGGIFSSGVAWLWAYGPKATQIISVPPDFGSKPEAVLPTEKKEQ